MDEFKRDLAENISAIGVARTTLLERVRSLTDDDLQRARRGGWSIQEVLHHVIDAEASYTKLIAHLRSIPMDVPGVAPEDVASASAAVAALERYRATLLSAVEGVDEACFYELRSIGHEQYSIVSVLENVASHDREHTEQLEKTAASTS